MPPSPLKILWVGDSPTVDTGFSRCTRVACDYLTRAGHTVAVLGINEPGDSPLDTTGWSLPSTPPFPYPIYLPSNRVDGGRDLFGVTRLPRLIHRLSPDLVVLLNDPWNVPAYFDYIDQYTSTLLASPYSSPSEKERNEQDARRILDTPVLGWMAVDGENQKEEEIARLRGVATWTEFGSQELISGGYKGPTSVIPLGVDTGLFEPLDSLDDLDQHRVDFLRLPTPLPPGAFLVGVVGRNQPRKRLDLALSSFATFLHTVPARMREKAYLYVHTAPTGERGVDVRSIAKYLGLGGHLILAEQPAGMGLPDGMLSGVYQCFDVYLSTSQGEGWGLPALEAMACGVPCVLPDWSAFSEWAAPAAVLIPCHNTAPTAPVNSQCHTIGGVVNPADVASSLSRLQSSTLQERRKQRRQYALEGRRVAEKYTWGKTGRRVVEWVEWSYMEMRQQQEQQREVPVADGQ